MIIQAKGYSKHHFWGDYYETIYLVFETRREAELALPRLQVDGLDKEWSLGDEDTPVLAIFVSGKQLELVEALLVSFGADPKAIGSVEHSIDFGDPFEVAIVVEDPAQTHLDLGLTRHDEAPAGRAERGALASSVPASP